MVSRFKIFGLILIATDFMLDYLVGETNLQIIGITLWQMP